MQVNYDELVAAYNVNIENNLRGFTGGPPPFETWVPYEGDHNKSITDLIDLAIEAGIEVLTIRTTKEIADKFVCGGYKQGVAISLGEKIVYITSKAVGIESILNSLVMHHGFSQRIEVVGLKKSVVTIDYEDSIGGKPLHESLIKIEREAKKFLGFDLDIQTLNIDDKNKRKCAK